MTDSLKSTLTEPCVEQAASVKVAPLKLDQLIGQINILEGILVNIPSGLYIYEPVYDSANLLIDFHLILLNPLANKLLDQPMNQLIGKSLTQLMDNIFISDLLFLAIQVYQTRHTLHLATEYHRKGVNGWFKLSISRHEDRIIVTTIDITDLKKAQVQLQSTTDKLQTMLDGTPTAIALLKAVRDPEGNLIDLVYQGANEKLAIILKRPVKNIIGQSYLTLFPEAPHQIFDDYAQVVETGVPRRFERYFQQNPLVGWFDISIIKNDDGVVVSYVDINNRKDAERQLETIILDLKAAKNQTDRDVTRLKIAEEEINRVLDQEREINKFQSQFIAFVSHQFRNPMAGILLAAEALALLGKKSVDTVLAHKIAQYTKQTRLEIQRLDTLLTKVLFKDQVQMSQIAFRLEESDLVEFCQNLIENQKQQHADYQRIEFQSDQQEIWAKVDPVILEQVIENLMSNALKYSAESPKPVEVRLDTQANDVLITVKDYGIGIPAEELEHIGKSFYRASNTNFIPGIGLGLSLSRQFIKQHGGQLEVESELNQYTFITILLPRII